MARVENKPKVILTKEEIETLKKTRKILSELDMGDRSNDIYENCDNYDGEWKWIEIFLEKLIDISEVE